MPQTKTPPAANQAFYAHINGLRAIAILGILFYHLKATYCPAGYFGVDAFLVISGFLLLRSLLNLRADRPFNFGSFWLRKAWRILPSWLVLVLVVGFLSAKWMEYARTETILGTIASSTYFIPDYQIDLSGDYFNVFTQQNPLLHLWYLGITEQLYIFLPLLIVPLVRWCPRMASIALLALLSTLSLAFWIVTNLELPSSFQHTLLGALGMKSAYYHLIPRLWEIGAGGLVLLLPALEGRRTLRTILAVAALGGLIASYFLYETGSSAVYIAVVASVVLLKYGDSAICRHILCSKPLQAIGSISFSLYLWHWPIMVFWKYICMDNPDTMDECGMVLLSFAMATIAWFLVERIKAPSLQAWKGTLQRRSILAVLPAVFFAAALLDEHLQPQEGQASQSQAKNIPSNANAPAEAPKTLYPLSEIPGHDNDPSVQKGFNRRLFKRRNPIRTIGDDTDVLPSFFVLGDSHAYHLYDGLYEACQEHHIRGLHLNNSTVPYWNFELALRSRDSLVWNKTVAEHIFRYLQERPEVTHVIVSVAWAGRMKLPGKDWRNGTEISSEEDCLKQSAQGMRETCKLLRSIGKTVILLGDVHRFSSPSPIDSWKRCQSLGIPYEERFISNEAHREANKEARLMMEQLHEEGLAIYIDPAPVLMREGKYPDRIDGEFLHADTDHLSRAGSRLVGKYIIEELLRLKAEAAQSGKEAPKED